MQPAVWTATKAVHKDYGEEFRKATLCLLLVHRFGIARTRTQRRFCHSSPPPLETDALLVCPAIERIPAELWREILSFCSRNWIVSAADEVSQLRNV